MPTPTAPRNSSTRQFARMRGESLTTWRHAKGARIRIAKSQRKKVMAMGGISSWNPRPTIQLQAQKNGASVSRR